MLPHLKNIIHINILLQVDLSAVKQVRTESRAGTGRWTQLEPRWPTDPQSNRCDGETRSASFTFFYRIFQKESQLTYMD